MPKTWKFHLCTVAGVLAAASWAAGQDVNTPPNLPATIPPVVEVPVVAGPSGGGEGSTRSGQPATLGGGSKASGGDPTTTGRAQEVGNRHLGQSPLKSYYDYDNDGFGWETEDGEFSIRVRGMTQLDGRVYNHSGQEATSNGFYNPRTRVYFEGHFTEPLHYEFSFQNTFDTLALLDAYINVSYDPRFQVRLGRFKTPFTYEWYRVHIWDTLAPERSLYATNYESNRRFGLMALGVLLDNRVEYAVGTFNTQRNSFQAFNSRQDVMAFLHFKPFYNREEGFLLRDFQFGGSIDAGNENQSPIPAALRTNSAPSGNPFDTNSAGNAATLPFLAFNPGVLERGGRALWELHAAWYHGGLSMMGAWQGGHESYALTANGPRTHVPIHGWFVQAGYILTGETIRDRTLIDPLSPFDLRRGRVGPGAWEPTVRYSELELDRRVFTAGLADPTRWTNRTRMIDVGCNWYLNKFIKVYAGWERALFADPVFTSSGRAQKSMDLYWVRTQVYF